MKPVKMPAALTLNVPLSLLRDLLFWLPPANSVVLYRSPDLCLSATQAVRHLPGVAPVYMLSGLDTPSERLGSSTKCDRDITK